MTQDSQATAEEEALNPVQLLVVHIGVYAGVWAMLRPGSGQGAWALAVAAPLIWLSVTDFRSYILPDLAQLLLLGVSLAWLALERDHDLPVHLAGALVWALAVWAVGWVFRLRHGFDGLGFGDVKLMVSIGILTGPYRTGIVLGSAACAAILVLLLGAVFKGSGRAKVAQIPVAFGPFLCLSAWAIWLLGF